MGAGKEAWGWYPAGKVWVPMQVAATGKLVIDPTALFEEPPTNGEMGKAATSNWSFDHNANVNAHHARLHTMSDVLDHAGEITDAQHGVRATALAHAHAALSGIGADDHHNRQHVISAGADHTGSITDAQHGVRTLANAHAHAALSGIGADDHHNRQHVISAGADHTGSITDAQHGVRTLANAHAHAALSGVTANQHHNRLHTMSDALDHTGRIALTQMTDGAAGLVLTSQGAGSDPVYAAVSGAKVNSGSYTGNDSANRAIAHGLGVTPKIVLMKGSTDTKWFEIFGAQAMIGYNFLSQLAVTIPNTTNFYVGNATSYSQSANSLNVIYYWVAIG